MKTQNIDKLTHHMDDGVCNVLNNEGLNKIIICGLNDVWSEWVDPLIFIYTFIWVKQNVTLYTRSLLLFVNKIKFKIGFTILLFRIIINSCKLI